jgi:hypothetical protein
LYAVVLAEEFWTQAAHLGRTIRPGSKEEKKPGITPAMAVPVSALLSINNVG